ncbi:NUDIX domain-containing protein [Pseudoruegeria sp. HB172150]|uniref:NUDIX hydrolase n=1 Tax=Pseudoruegeria sp. HB172150 TaxID=2721164 RepID=UPI0015529E9F|nr:NUDIX domain-containing protein [Pseudoruegeria sp. HB172150]
MSVASKSCPVVTRRQGIVLDVLAFVHPCAGKQFVKGTIEAGETPLEAARRELREESGLIELSTPVALSVAAIGSDRQPWHFYQWIKIGLPDSWSHQTEDDGGHVFTFFWQPLDGLLADDWHPMFHEAFDFMRQYLYAR